MPDTGIARYLEKRGEGLHHVCLDTADVDAVINCVRYLGPSFGGINLEDIAAPKCFDIEEQLRKNLDIPVMHDDQHGTAVVVLAAMKNALKVVGKDIRRVKVVISGAGASAVATARILALAGASQVVLCDRAGAVWSGRTDNMNRIKEVVAAETNPKRERGSLQDVLKGADVVIGLSGPGILSRADVMTMADDPIVFALANPVPEVQPEDLVGVARVVATGRSDYPNQINNSLGFPGIFKGALEVEATDINEPMKLAAADAIASLVSDAELHEEYIIPSMFDPRVADSVAGAIREAAWSSGVARKSRPRA